MSMYTIERRQTTLSALRALGNTQQGPYINLPFALNNAAMVSALNASLAQQVQQSQAQTQPDIYAHQPVDYLPLAVATAAGFALGAAGIVMLLKKRGGAK